MKSFAGRGFIARHWLFSGAIVAALSAHAVGADTDSKTRIEAFSPQGTVKGVRQVTARFSAPMVAFGDPRLSDPFTIDCGKRSDGASQRSVEIAKEGSGRWVDSSSWSFDFERDLPAGVRCEFKLGSGVKDAAGNSLGGDGKFAFDTGGPAIIRSMPYEGSEEVDENQIFILGLDAPATPRSIKKNAYCQVDGVNEKIDVAIIEGKQREELLRERKDFLTGYAALYFQQRGVIWRSAIGLQDKRIEQLPIVLLQCRRALVPGSQVNLVWGAGIATANAVASAADQTLAFGVRPEFSAEFRCDRVNANAQCLPILPPRLDFSAPIRKADAQRIVLKAADGSVFAPQFDDSAAADEFVSRITFKAPLPESTKFSLELPADLRDDAGRPLANRANFPLAVATDEMPPLAKFAARFGIVELHGDALLPVTLRNLEPQLQGRLKALPASAKGKSPAIDGKSLRVDDGDDVQIIEWLNRIEGYEQEHWQDPGARSLFNAADGVDNFELPKPGGAKAFEVIGIPLKKPGFYVVELASPKLGAALRQKPEPMFVQSSALVTNLAVHFKRGSESSLVWVTTLDSAKPVAGAAIAVRNCKGDLLWSGSTDTRGVARIGTALPVSRCYRPAEFFISARSGDDMSFTLSDWTGGIQPWRFNLPTQSPNYRDNFIAHTVFDRTLLMAGDTVHMKHFARTHVEGGIALPQPTALPNKMVIRHVGTDQTYELALNWRNASADSEWKIPAGAKQGVYNVEIGRGQAGSFRVESFRLPTMKAQLLGPKTPAVRAAAVDLDVQVNYLAGGAASNMPVKVRSLIEPRVVSFRDYDDFTFSNGALSEGAAKQPLFAYGGDEDEEPADQGADEGSGSAQSARTQNFTLDANGAARVAIDKLPQLDMPSDLRTELEYRDANGETLTASTRIALWPARLVIGIKPDSWTQSRDELKVQALVLDLAGKPVANAEVSIDALQRNYLSHRRRLIGGFYAYENSSEIKKLGALCNGKTDGKGLLTCTARAPATGNLILQASARDAQGNATAAHTDTWVAGDEDMWFAASDNDRIDVLPEKKQYEPGDTATLQVRMPFREATALVTVEREGVLDSYVQQLAGKDPTVRVPIKNNYSPNMYVSVFVVRGRVADVQPTALIDLGKPAYKMGIAELRVGWKPHELKVAVSTDRDAYKIRDKVKVKVKVRRADGGALPAGSEIALAAVDEALLELMPNESWKLLDAMLQRRPLEVETSTAQMEVIGKRHFGRKAVPAGGGGGKAPARELFDAMLFWRPHIALDANGEASIEVPLNDALTSFRFVAIANAAAAQFGTGSAAVRSTQDLILVSGLPALVREGDDFRAGFTLRNTSQRPFAATINGKLAIASAAGSALTAPVLAEQTIAVPPGEAREFSWDLPVPADAASLQWDIAARDAGGGSDRLRIKQRAVPALPVRTLQATLVQLDQPLSLPVQLPADAIPGRGGVQTVLSAKLGGALPGVREYMSRYPYSCFEQQSSKAVALHDSAAWERLMQALPSYLDRDGLLKYFPQMDAGSDTLTAYVLAVADESGYPIPPQNAQRMRDALSQFVQGKLVRHTALPTADLAIRKIAALEALSRSGNVRAELLESIQLAPNLWPTSAVIDWRNILQRTPALPRRDERLAEADQILRSRLNLQGTTMGFSTERNDALWWLMISGDVNATRFLLSVLDAAQWQSDMGRLARGVLGRQQRGHWNTTVANAWGTLAIDKFSKKFEADAVTGTTQIALGGAISSADWQKKAQGDTVLQPWPQEKSALTIEHHGGGKPWATIQSRAAIPLRAPLSSGYKIVKTTSAIEQKQKGQWSVGDVYRVKLALEAQSDMTWVVVDDPIPAGASVLGSGLGGDSKLLTRGERSRGWVWPAFEERTFEAFRSYYDFVPKGKWSVEYTVRINNAGRFQLPPTRVEALYAPELFGEIPNASVVVGQ